MLQHECFHMYVRTCPYSLQSTFLSIMLELGLTLEMQRSSVFDELKQCWLELQGLATVCALLAKRSSAGRLHLCQCWQLRYWMMPYPSQ